MQQKVTPVGGVVARIADVRAALAAGRLSGYRPLKVSARGTQQTPMASWGPLMKR
jgi:hypothetical protein